MPRWVSFTSAPWVSFQSALTLEAENARLRKMYVEEKLKAEIVAEALAKKW